MPRRNRNSFESGIFHIMVQGLNKDYIFNNKELKIDYLRLVKKYKERYNIDIIAYCIMDNHAHMIIYTKDVEEISKFMHNINTIYSKNYNKKCERVGYVFRDRFKSQIINYYNYLLRCIKYVHMNPVKANIIRNESEYEFSSYHEYFEPQKYLNRNIISDFLKKEDIEKLKEMKYRDVEIIDIDRNDEENLEIAISDFMKDKNINIYEVEEEKLILNVLINELKTKGYKQNIISKKLQMNENKISRIIRNK